MRTQTSDIIDYLKDGNKLTQKEAINLFGCYRLASRICELKKYGYDIKSKKINVPTRYFKRNGLIKTVQISEYEMI
tara:strand:+ start:927 stop:1154 length:228 start_codon:yes stop_codon:yes gene_type:complete